MPIRYEKRHGNNLFNAKFLFKIFNYIAVLVALYSVSPLLHPLGPVI